jgi:hypothetical protein
MKTINDLLIFDLVGFFSVWFWVFLILGRLQKIEKKIDELFRQSHHL